VRPKQKRIHAAPPVEPRATATITSSTAAAAAAAALAAASTTATVHKAAPTLLLLPVPALDVFGFRQRRGESRVRVQSEGAVDGALLKPEALHLSGANARTHRGGWITP